MGVRGGSHSRKARVVSIPSRLPSPQLPTRSPVLVPTESDRMGTRTSRCSPSTPEGRRTAKEVGALDSPPGIYGCAETPVFPRCRRS